MLKVAPLRRDAKQIPKFQILDWHLPLKKEIGDFLAQKGYKGYKPFKYILKIKMEMTTIHY